MVDTGLVKDQRAIEPLDAMQAWSKFKNLPTYVQQIFAEQVLFNLLTRVGEDYNNAASPYFQKYSRGYEAINTLFLRRSAIRRTISGRRKRYEQGNRYR